jgi:hypothetical protein
MADHRCTLDVECLEQRGEIVSIGIHVIAGPRLIRSTMAAAIMSNNAVAVVPQKQHLGVPGVCGERPSMRERDDRTGAPVLEVDLRAVFHCRGRHGIRSFMMGLVGRRFGIVHRLGERHLREISRRSHGDKGDEKRLATSTVCGSSGPFFNR